MSKPLSAVDCIGPAFTQTKKQLFAPFQFRRWACLAWVGLLTGEFAGGGGRVNIPSSRPHQSQDLFASELPHWDQILPWLPWILGGFVLFVLLILLWIYVASVFRFVLFDSVLHDRCELKGSWTRWEPRGRSYFLWCLAMFAGVMVGTVLLIGGPLLIAWRAGLFHHPNEHLAALILGGVALFFILLTLMVLIAIASLFAKDFCVPFMAMEDLGIMDAWRRLLPTLAAEKMAFTGYVLMKIVLAIGSAIIFGLITLLVMLVLLIPLGIVGVIAFFVGKAAGLTLSVAVICILIALGCLLLAGLLYLVALISTPAMVFFQSYTLHFLGSRYPALGAIVFPPPPEPQVPPMVDLPPGIEPAPAG